MVSIQIAAPSGSLCEQTEQRINQLIDSHGLDCSVELVHDFERIIDLGVYAIPGLLIDGTLKSVGRVPEIGELIDWLDLDRAL
jgi:small redox-active disulfide protein 2